MRIGGRDGFIEYLGELGGAEEGAGMGVDERRRSRERAVLIPPVSATEWEQGVSGRVVSVTGVGSGSSDSSLSEEGVSL